MMLELTVRYIGNVLWDIVVKPNTITSKTGTGLTEYKIWRGQFVTISIN